MQIQYVKDNFNLSLFLEETQTLNPSLRSKISGCKHFESTLIIYISALLTGEERTDLNTLVENHDETLYVYPLILDYVEKDYLNFPLSKVDFTMHLKEGLAVAKSLFKAPNGRPQYAEYKLDDNKIAKIEWQFYDATGGLYYRKELKLSYYNSDGSEGVKFLIKREDIDFTVPNQLAKSIQERVNARQSIVDEIKAVCSGSLQVVLQLNLEQVVNLITPFWDEFKVHRENFIELAHKAWQNDVAVIDLTDPNYSWLTTPIDANGTTCQQYMLFRLGY